MHEKHSTKCNIYSFLKTDQKKNLLEDYEEKVSLILIRSIYEKTKNKFGGLILTDFKIHYAAAKSLQLCSTLCDPIDCGLPGSAVPGILHKATVIKTMCSISEEKKRIDK